MSIFDDFFHTHGHLSERDLLYKILANTISNSQKLDKIMAQQDQLNADVAVITAALSGISSDVSGIQAEIAALQAQVAAGGQLDLTALDALATQAASVKTAVDGLIPAVTAAPAQ